MPYDLLIRGAILVDGTGTPGRPADAAVTGDRITAVGDLSAVPDADAASVIDRATFEAPGQYPTGIPHVIVNGRLAVRDGAETGEHPGRLLRFAP